MKPSRLGTKSESISGPICVWIVSAAGALLKHAVLRGGWKDGTAGWLAAYSTAAGAMMKHAALLELQGLEKQRTSREKA